MSDPEYLKVPQVAARLQIHPETVRVWLREGKLRGVRLGGPKTGYRIPASEVERLLQEGAAR